MKGNIQQRGPRTWRLRYDVPRPEGRKQVSETVHGNKRDAQRALRELHRPLGVRAVVGEEYHDDVQFDMTNDRLVLDAKTPSDMDSGGGFGPTVQIEDETLVTSYSWRDAEHISHVEVVRWRLPD